MRKCVLRNYPEGPMLYVYRVEFETDPKTGQITAKLPSLNHTADFGDTAEEAVANLRVLAAEFIEALLKEGKPAPPATPPTGGSVPGSGYQGGRPPTRCAPDLPGEASLPSGEKTNAGRLR